MNFQTLQDKVRSPEFRQMLDQQATNNGWVRDPDYLPDCPCDACLSRVRAQTDVNAPTGSTFQNLSVAVHGFTPVEFRRLEACRRAIAAGYYTDRRG